MKNLVKKPTYIFLLVFTLILSITFSSCTDNKAYTVQIQKADSLFTGQKFEEAKAHYAKALELNKDEVYPTEQIKKINVLLSKRVDVNYSNKIKEADSFFKNKQYNKAKKAYVDAGNIKPNESYPKTKISEITIAATKVKVVESKPFHIIAGSYALRTNATERQKKLTAIGRKSTLIRSRDGNYLVSLNSLSTITKAYNYLITLEEDFDTSIWVYKID